MKYSGPAARKMSKFWYTASAVPRYQVASSKRCCAGRRSRNSFISGRRKDQPICKWRNKLCALYCVKTQIRRTPELRQFDNAKSMMRNLPPKKTAGLARRSVSCFSRLPRPPARTSASVRLANRSWTRAEESMGVTSDYDARLRPPDDRLDLRQGRAGRGERRERHLRGDGMPHGIGLEPFQ